MIILPPALAPNAVNMRVIDQGFKQEPATGGDITRVDRPGNRYEAMFSTAPLERDLGRVMISRLIQAVSEEMQVDLPLYGVDQSGSGNPRSNGTNQEGRIIICDGFTPGFAILEGFWITLTANGRSSTHIVTNSAFANSNGQATIAVNPPLRRPLPNNTPINFAPFIQGFVTDDQLSWEWSLAHQIPLSFTIKEAR